jgi:hypothetical protein
VAAPPPRPSLVHACVDAWVCARPQFGPQSPSGLPDASRALQRHLVAACHAANSPEPNNTQLAPHFGQLAPARPLLTDPLPPAAPRLLPSSLPPAGAARGALQRGAALLI